MAVRAVETTRASMEVLWVLLGVEHALGRKRTQRNGPRNIDLDLLLYGDEEIETAALSVPHPRMHERRFVLVPLVEVEPTQYCPRRGESMAALLKHCADPDQPRVVADTDWQMDNAQG